MNCPRCHGLMVRDAYLNLEGEGNQIWVTAWRCINCGDIMDATMLQNRFRQQRERQSQRAGAAA